MEPSTCDHCGRGIEAEGIRHRRRLFCSDECCEEFEDTFMVKGEPDPVDLDEDLGDLDPLDDEADLDDLDDLDDGDDPLDALADDDF